jgi:hypothetical protein
MEPDVKPVVAPFIKTAAHDTKVREASLRTLFADDPARGERMTTRAAGIHFERTAQLERPERETACLSPP